MNHRMREAEAYAQKLRDFASRLPGGIQAFIVPPYTVLHRVCDILKGTPVLVGAQNMHWEDKGAYTGEISPLMVKDSGAQLVELGHSERRAMFGETDQMVRLKVQAALRHGLIPLVCVGETLDDKRLGVAAETVARQVKIALAGVPQAAAGRVVLAYEPVWAIGASGVAAEPDYANDLHGVIRRAVAAQFGPAAAGALPILYGGSVSLDNSLSFLAQPEVDGLFIGRAAWDSDGLIAILRAVAG